MKFTSKFVFGFVKLVALLIVLIIGIRMTYEGYLLAGREPSPEIQPPFEATLQPTAGALVGKVKIQMNSTQAFVVGDHITAEVEVQVNWVKGWENESAMVQLMFPESICFIDSWSNISYYNWRFTWWDYQSYEATYVIYRQKITLWYTHEGVFGVNLTVYSEYSKQLLEIMGTTDRTIDFSFPDVVHIKSYSYLEARKNTQLTNALTLEIFGLTVIATSPIAVQLISLIQEAYEGISKKRDDESNDKKKSFPCRSI